MATRFPSDCESLLSLKVAAADITRQVFIHYIYPAIWTMVGISGNAFIIRSEFRSLGADVKELGTHLEESGTLLEEFGTHLEEFRADLSQELNKMEEDLNADIKELKTDIGKYRSTLEESIPAGMKDACAVVNRREGS